MTNPYVLASVRKMREDRRLRLPAAQGDGPVPTGQAGAFLEATAIGHAGNRARVLTGIARTLIDRQALDLLASLLRERDTVVARLRELDAPEVIVANAARDTTAMGILRRVLKRRGL